MTLRTALARFIQQLEADGRSPLTISVYARELRRFVTWAGPRSDVRKIQPVILARYLTEPSLQVTPRGAKRNARTMNRTKTALRFLFFYLAVARTVRNDAPCISKNARAERPLPSPTKRGAQRAGS